MNRTRATALIAAALAIPMLSGCSTISTAPDEAGLHYKGGAISSQQFANCVGTGTREWNGPGDEHYAYPAGQRTYTFAVDKGDGGVIVATDVNGVPLTTAGVITFTMNTDCEVLQKFHESIGIKYGADKDGVKDWSGLLATYMRQPLERAIADATQGLDWKVLYTDPAVKAQWEARVKELLPQYVAQTAGGDYFGNFAVTIQKPDLPENLATAITATQEAIQQNEAQKERNAQVATELESIRALVAILGPDGYNTYQAIKDGRLTVVPIPQGGAINVTPPAQ